MGRCVDRLVHPQTSLACFVTLQNVKDNNNETGWETSETETESDRDKGSHPSLCLSLSPTPPCSALKHGCWSAYAHTDNQTDRQLDTLAPYHGGTYTQTATHSVMGFAFNPATLTILRGREGTHTHTHTQTHTQTRTRAQYIHKHTHITY